MFNTADKIESIMRNSRTNFFFSTLFLNKNKGEGLKVIYAFCRKTDDIVDDSNADDTKKQKMLEKWKNEFVNALGNNSDDEFMNRVTEIINRFNINPDYFYELIDGVGMDINKNRYENFNDLYQYCYRVASSVGLAAIEIFGYKNPVIKDYAVNLGIALQLTNIIRDVAWDAKKNRIYIPLEDIARFNYSVNKLKSGVYDDSFVELMNYQYERANRFYEKAKQCFDKTEAGSLVSARIMEEIYFKLLNKIKSQNFSIFETEIKLSGFTKLFTALSTYLRCHI